MPHVSRRKISDKNKVLLDDALIFAFSDLKPQEVGKIFATLLTKTEQTMLAKRLGIAYFLKQGVEETEIAEGVKTTRQTVARIRLQLLAGPEDAYQYLLNKLSEWHQIRAFKKLVKDAAISAANKIIRGARGVS